jgi:hypothetical protein
MDMDKRKSENQDAFIKGDVQIMVATTALEWVLIKRCGMVIIMKYPPRKLCSGSWSSWSRRELSADCLFCLR